MTRNLDDYRDFAYDHLQMIEDLVYKLDKNTALEFHAALHEIAYLSRRAKEHVGHLYREATQK